MAVLLPSNYVAHLNPAGLLMEKEPTNLQALSLAQLIEKGVTRGTSLCNLSFAVVASHIFVEGYIGMALVGGAAALGTIVLAGLIRRATRK